MAIDWAWTTAWARARAWVHPVVQASVESSCRHGGGLDVDGEVMRGAKVVARHYRCRTCHIIVETRSV